MHPSERTAREKETTVETAPGMRKERLLKEDGRYVVFYGFDEQEEEPAEEGGAR